jgi:uncharacterized protein YbjT (DUF2867 family)
MSHERRAVLAGATGLVGREILQRLADDERCGSIVLLLRRPAPELSSPKARSLLVDFDTLAPLPACDDVYVALGTTIDVAGSRAAFRRVDYDYVVAVARAGLAAGATRLGLVSALGADPSSRLFYNRVKGEAEREVSALGFERVVLARPSLLLGDRARLGQRPRAGEAWATRLLAPLSSLIPARFRPVAAADVARALVDTLRDDDTHTGVTTIESRDMHRP